MRLLRPGPKTARHEKRPESRRQEIEEKKRQNERKLFAQILAQRVLDRQCSGGNFEEQKNDDGGRNNRDPSGTHLITKKITDACAEHATNHNRNEK